MMALVRARLRLGTLTVTATPTLLSALGNTAEQPFRPDALTFSQVATVGCYARTLIVSLETPLVSMLWVWATSTAMARWIC